MHENVPAQLRLKSQARRKLGLTNISSRLRSERRSTDSGAAIGQLGDRRDVADHFEPMVMRS